jgi:hypothetical protein
VKKNRKYPLSSGFGLLELLLLMVFLGFLFSLVAGPHGNQTKVRYRKVRRELAQQGTKGTDTFAIVSPVQRVQTLLAGVQAANENRQKQMKNDI